MKDAAGADHQIPDSYWLEHGGIEMTCPECQEAFIGLTEEFRDSMRPPETERFTDEDERQMCQRCDGIRLVARMDNQGLT